MTHIINRYQMKLRADTQVESPRALY